MMQFVVSSSSFVPARICNHLIQDVVLELQLHVIVAEPDKIFS